MHTRRWEFALVVIVLLTLAGVATMASEEGTGGPSAGVAISGRVTDSDGTPIEGAAVSLVQMIYGEAAFAPDPKTVDEKTTAGDGTFTLVIPPEVDPEKGSYVVARKAGFSVGWASWRLRENQPVNISLGQGKDLAGEVVDEQGQPIEDAEVRIAAVMIVEGRARQMRKEPGFLRARTDDKGRFVFADLPVEATFALSVEKAGRAVVTTLNRMMDSSEGSSFSPGQAGIKVVSPLEGRIEGVVVNKADGKPVGGVRVRALSTSQAGMRLSPRPVSSGEDGTFRIGGLVAGGYSVQIVVPTNEPAEWVAEPVQVFVEAGQTAGDVKLQVNKGGVIELLVKDSAGKPIAGASVSFYNMQNEQSLRGTTDENGLARVRGTAGEYRFMGAYKDGFARRTVQEQVTVEDGQTTKVEHVMETLSKVAGIVRDPAGNPLAGVKIVIAPVGSKEILTDQSGRFEVASDSMIMGLPDAQQVVVARDADRGLAKAVDVDEQAGSLDIRLEPAVTIMGTVLDNDGKPLPGARVRVMLHGGRWIGPIGRDELSAGSDGTFEAKLIPAGRQYTISAMAGGYGKCDVSIDTSDLKDNHYDAGSFKLPLANLSVTGVVVDVNDEPVAGANVRAYGDGQPEQLQLRPVQSDGEGKFTVSGICPGMLRVSVDVRGQIRQSGMAQVEAGASDVKIVVSGRTTAARYVPRKPAPLKGKPLPPLQDVGIDLPADAEGKTLLVCFWDIGQRPSRYCVTQLAARAAELAKKGVTVVAVQAGKAEDEALSEWIEGNKIPFPIGRIVGDIDKTRFAWGVVSLPHLILTDGQHKVIAEGFSPADLDKQLEAAGR